MKTSLPLASILVNNYNYGPFLRDAIDSALNQTYPNIEVIVVDDGSTDDSREIIAAYGDRIIPILKENGGQGSALNAGFAASKGEWIHLLDSDDLFLPNKVQNVWELATECPLVGLIAHNLEYCTANEEPLDFLPPDIQRRSLIDDRTRARHGKLTASLPATSGLCIRRDVMGRVLPMPEEIRITADNYVKVVLLAMAPALLVPEAWAKQRIHGRNLYTQSDKDPDETARLRCAVINAMIAFHLRKEYPYLIRLTWRQYGRILYQLRSCGSERSQAVEAEIRSKYSVMNHTLSCLICVSVAFAKAFLKDVFRMGARTFNRERAA